MSNLDFLGRVVTSGLSLSGVYSPVTYDKIALTVGGGGAQISTGFKGYIESPFSCTIERVTALADQAGDCEVDIWISSFADFPPTIDDSITGGNYITLNNTDSYRDSTLTGWTKNISSGDIIGFNVNSASLIERLNLILTVKRS